MSVLRNITRLGMAALLSSGACSAHGQAVFGSIYGTVQDASGAVVPNATITITDAAKGIAVTEKSNASGEYTVGHLIPDPYNVKIEAPGFQTFETKGITVVVDSAAKVDANLTIGSEAQVVEVKSDSIPQLKTDNADVSSSLSAKEIQDLPVPGRNVTGLQLLLPGAQQLGFAHAASENPQGSLQIQVDGQAFGGTAFELDGTDNQDPILGIIVINPNPDSLTQQKIATQNFDAEFGKAVSAVVTDQTKSGANSLHGSGFWYRESAAQLARDPFTQGPSQLVNSPFPKALRSQFGGSLGGPIKRDKAFFFLDYQGLRQKVGTTDLQTVPSANVISTCLGQSVGRAGIPGCDFSEYGTAALGATNGRDIYDPLNGSAQFPGNVIPLSRVSPQAQGLFRLLQPYKPNTFTDSTYAGLRNNYAASGIGSLNSDQWDERVDYQFKENIHAFERFSRFTDILNGPTIFGAAGGDGFGLGGFGGLSQGANDSAAAGFDYAINAKLVTDVRAGYYRYNIGTQKYDQNVQLANQLGIPGMNLGTYFTSGAPSFQLSEVGNSGNSTAIPAQGQGPQYGAGLNVDHCNCPLTEREDQYQIVNNWTRSLGNHELKFGADLRYARNLRVPSDNDRTGILQFFTGPTSNPNAAAGVSQGGLSFASFALGNVPNFNRFVSTSTNAKEFQKRTFFYAQDTWRASQKLTLNYGLRYEIYFPEAINAPAQGGVLDLATGYIRVAGVGTVGSNLNFSKSSFPLSPRLGATYQVSDKTVIRAGYGRSFDIGVFGSIFGHVATQNLPVLASQQLNSTTGQTGSAFTLAGGPPASQPVAIPTNGLLPSPGYAVNARSRPTTVRLPTIDAWNLSVQQAISPTLSVTFAYVGNKGTHTLSGGDGNSTNPNEAAISLPAQYSITGQALHYDSNPLYKSTISPTGGTGNPTYLRRYYGGGLPACSDPAYATPAGVNRGQCGWSNDVTYYGDNQDTHYNALQISVAKQFTKGYSVNANYAWQHAYNYASGFATWDKRATYGRDGYTREQSFILYGLAELPFGRNKFFLHNASGIVNQVVGGWQFTPIITWQSGLPFTLNYGECPASIPGSAPCYVNGPVRSLKMGASGYPGGPTGVTYFQAQKLGGQFTAAPLDTIGNSGRNSVFGPNYFNGDLSLSKNFPIRESLFAQFRIDAYNGFNHINFGVPGGPTTEASANIENTGSITGGPLPGSSTNPRQLQLSVRMQF